MGTYVRPTSGEPCMLTKHKGEQIHVCKLLPNIFQHWDNRCGLLDLNLKQSINQSINPCSCLPHKSCDRKSSYLGKDICCYVLYDAIENDTCMQ